MTNDLISRRKLDGMRLAVPDFVNPDQRTKGWNECITYIQQNAPVIDAAPVVHASYGFVGPHIGSLYADHGTCGNCKERILIDPQHKNFCPHCGARMDREECMDAERDH